MVSNRAQTNWFRVRTLFLLLAGAFLSTRTAKGADKNNKDHDREVVVGTKVTPPFVVQNVVQRQYHHQLRVLPGSFYRQDYAFALSMHSPLREPINRTLPDKVTSIP